MSHTTDRVIKRMNDEMEIMADFNEQFDQFLSDINTDIDDYENLEYLDDTLSAFIATIRSTKNQLESLL